MKRDYNHINFVVNSTLKDKIDNKIKELNKESLKKINISDYVRNLIIDDLTEKMIDPINSIENL